MVRTSLSMPGASRRSAAALLTLASVSFLTPLRAEPVRPPVLDQEAAPLPATVSPAAAEVRYIGRFDMSEAAGPRCSWPNSEVTIAFDAAALNVRIEESGNSDEYEVVVDGVPTLVLAPQAGLHVYRVFQSASSKSHVVEIVKRTESFFGTGRFAGFELSEGGKIKNLPKRPAHRLEVVGDSISVGYGNEASDKGDRFTPQNTNAYLAYGAVASRALDAEYSCIAWSGRKMWPADSMPAIYDRILATDDNSVWDHRRWTPDVIVINLSTNDFGGKYPKLDEWTAAYKDFLARLRLYYPKAVIYCAISPMVGGDERTASTRYITKVVADEQADGDKNVRIIEFAEQKAEDGFGADWHPSVKTNQIMAKKLEEVLERDLKWKAQKREAHDAPPQ